MLLRPRTCHAATTLSLVREGVPPLLARVLVGRGISALAEVYGSLSDLHAYSLLKGAQEAAVFLADCIEHKRPILVVADYDCDGATACVVALRGLRAFGAEVNYVVPDRMVHGYGLTPSVVEMAFARYPASEVILTVDNGIASHSGVECARSLGLDVVITDHHLPSPSKPLPEASVIVDPSQPGCTFPSKALAGVGVVWYVLWALQVELRRREKAPASFRVSELLPFVALGTVADVVPLDRNNRTLVQAGLERIRAGKSFPGIEALATAGPANRTQVASLLTSHFAFGLGPRLNAAGRLETMDQGIACLMAATTEDAEQLAAELDEINQTRKDVEHDIVVEAVAQAESLVREGTASIAVHSPDWHPGVIGIVAGRIKERRYRPTFVLATDAATGAIKGSGRSIPGYNLKDALDAIDKEHPGLMPKFGGHAMAAGVTLCPGGFELFRDALEAHAVRFLNEDLLRQELLVDGSLGGVGLTIETAALLSGPPWGQTFPEPVFLDSFEILEAKLTGPHKDQLNLLVSLDGVEVRATRFRHEGPVPAGKVRMAYKLSVTCNRKVPELKLLIDFIETV